MEVRTTTARERMLAAGAAIWTTGSTPEVFAGLSVTAVARAAQVTRSTFYAHWPTPEEYLRDLVHHLADPVWGPKNRDLPSERAAFRAGGSRLLDRLLGGCDTYIEAHADDGEFPLRLGLVARAHDPELADALREALATADSRLIDQLQRFDVTWGRDPRPPFESHQIAAILGALADGIAVRHRLEPERFPLQMYGRAVVSLLLTLTRHPDDGRDHTDVITAINDWPASGWTATPRSSPIDAFRLADDDVRMLVTEANRLNVAEGWQDVTLPRLAALTSTPEALLVRTFGSKPGLGMAMFLFNVNERYVEFEPTSDALADLRALITIRGEELQRTTSLAPAMLHILSGNVSFARRQTFSFDPHPRFVAGVRRAQDEGHLDPALDTEELTLTLECTNLFSHMALVPQGFSNLDPIDLVLRGAQAPRMRG